MKIIEDAIAWLVVIALVVPCLVIVAILDVMLDLAWIVASVFILAAATIICLISRIANLLKRA
ncbi:hypothetical protein [Campylobacter curvus]|uniref:hypothetical protein n=1 Tax=Campylobacter curvus TaxID=200 RepID=UPI0014702360|nr:hypothetical protein [Campylobacter curvus]